MIYDGESIDIAIVEWTRRIDCVRRKKRFVGLVIGDLDTDRDVGVIVDIRQYSRVSAGDFFGYQCQTWFRVVGGKAWRRESPWAEINAISWQIIQAFRTPLGFEWPPMYEENEDLTIKLVPELDSNGCEVLNPDGKPKLVPVRRKNPPYCVIRGAQPRGTIRNNMDEQRLVGSPPMRMFNADFLVEVMSP